MKRVHVRKQVPANHEAAAPELAGDPPCRAAYAPGEDLEDALLPVPEGDDTPFASPGPFARAAAAVTS